MLEKIKNILRDTDERQLLHNVLGNYILKFGSMILVFLLMPKYIQYFESQKLLGVWLTSLEIYSLAVLFDFGIGYGVRNLIVEPLHKNDTLKLKKIISTGFISVTLIVLIITAMGSLIIYGSNWNQLLNVSTEEVAKLELRKIILAFMFGMALYVYSSVINSILFALQKAIIPYLLIFISDLSIYVYIKYSLFNNFDFNFINLIYVKIISTIIPLIIVLFYLFKKPLKGTLPSTKHFCKKSLKSIFNLGGKLFIIQLLVSLLFNMREIYISILVGTDQVVEYQVYFKILGSIGTVYIVALRPVWSAVTKANVEKNKSRILSIFKRNSLMLLVLSVFQLVLLMLFPVIARIWLGDSTIELNVYYGLIFCFYNVLYMWLTLNFNIVSGMNRTEKISFCLTIAVILNIVLSVVFSFINSTWISILLATSISIIPCAIIIPNDLMKAIDKI